MRTGSVHAETQPATGAVAMASFRNCRRCMTHAERVRATPAIPRCKPGIHHQASRLKAGCPHPAHLDTTPAPNGVATSSSPFRSLSHGDEDIAAPKHFPQGASQDGPDGFPPGEGTRPSDGVSKRGIPGGRENFLRELATFTPAAREGMLRPRMCVCVTVSFRWPRQGGPRDQSSGTRVGNPI